MSSRTQAERITALEVQVAIMTEELRDSNRKLDDLLSVKNRGIGAFWLATALVGTSLAGFVNFIVDWVKG